MNIRYISFLGAMSAAIPAIAQIDPTVEVTNDYERSLNVTKPSIEMAVPDSLLRFDLDFDYSVFENPYKGGYDFSPYLMDMKPEANDYFGGKFYLRAGAGYSLHPAVDFAYQPVSTGKFSLNLHGRHRSYIGDYWNVTDVASKSGGHSGSWSGRDMDTRLGLDGRLEWKRGTFYFGIDGSALDSKSKWSQDDFYRGGGKVGIRSNDKVSSKFSYDFSFDAHYGYENLHGEDGGQGYADIGVHAVAGPSLGKGSRLLVGAGVESSSFGDGSLLDAYVNPKYVYDNGPLSLSLGLRFGYVYSTVTYSYPLDTKSSYEDGITYVDDDGFDHGQIVYPDVRISFEAVKDRLSLYASVTGGEKLNSFNSLKSARHFFDRNSICSGEEGCGSSYEDYNAALGVAGNISSILRFDVRAGFVSWNNGMLDAVQLSGGLSPALSFGDYDMMYASARIVLDTKRVLADGHVRFASSDAYDNDVLGFAGAPFEGSLRVRYNWRERIYLGVSGSFASSRKGLYYGNGGGMVTGWIPSWFDLGVSAEYALTGKLSLWAEGGNLLGSKVMVTPLCCGKGAYATAGITLHL